jgi:non-homologous end joining protein Ku
MLEAKLAGEEIARPEPEAEEAPVVDLMEALRKSVAEASKTKKASAAKPAAKKKTAARPRAKAGARKSA